MRNPLLYYMIEINAWMIIWVKYGDQRERDCVRLRGIYYPKGATHLIFMTKADSLSIILGER